jgi:hypothetical protein
MAIVAVTELTRHGLARRVTVMDGNGIQRFENVGVWLEPETRLAHLLDPEMDTHLATVPLDAVFVEWGDLSAVRAAGAGFPA